jgi:hypothetical protein
LMHSSSKTQPTNLNATNTRTLLLSHKPNSKIQNGLCQTGLLI